MILDEWQKEVLECKSKRILICKGRQIGGTTILAKKAADRLANNKGEEIMVVSITEDQAQLVIIMVLNFLEKDYKNLISKKKQDTTKSKILLKNGSLIISRPIGQTGDSVRGFTKGVLWLNEGSRIPEFAFEAAKPMLLTTAGEIWIDSTPHGKKGYFYNAFLNKNNIWKVFYKNTVDVINERPISESWTEEQKKGALQLLEDERLEMTTSQFGQEYLGLFMEDVQRFFSDELIEEVCKLKRPETTKIEGKNYIGCDIARLGDDEGTIEVINENKSKYTHIENIITKKQLTPQTERLIVEQTILWNARKVGIDAGSGTLGVSVLDHLNETKIKYKTVAMNNKGFFLDKDGKQKQTMKKVDYYNNFKAMLEHGDLKLLDDDEVKASLRSIQYEHVLRNDQPVRMEIFGNYSHVVEGLIRAVWLAKKEKSLNLFATYSNSRKYTY